MKKHIYAMAWSVLTLAAIALTTSCAKNGSNEVANEYTIENNIIIVPESSPLTSRLEVEAIKSTAYTPQVTASAEVQAIPSGYAEVGAPFSGRISASLVSPGDKVSAGTPLFRISSSDYMEVCRAAFDARTEKEQAARALERTRRMHQGKMASDRELEEAQADFDIKSRAAANAEASLKVYGADINTLVPGEPLTVKSPVTGTVVSNNLITGQYVKEDADAAVVVADLSKVWVVAAVKEQDLSNLKGVSEARVSIPSLPDTVFTGTIHNISDILNPSTRTAELIVICDNRTGELKPNMFGTVTIDGTAVDALMVPTSALRRKEDIVYVMRKCGDAHYEGVKVQPAESNGSFTRILGGLNPGDEIVTKGAFYLPEPQI